MARVMQSPRNRFSTSNRESQIWQDWLRSDRAANSSWGSSTLSNNDSACDLSKDADEDIYSTFADKLATPVPDLIPSNESSSNVSSTRTASFDHEEMPRIPFVSSATLASSIALDNPDHYPSTHVLDDIVERPFWSVMRSSPSKSVLATRSDVTFGYSSDPPCMPPCMPPRYRQRSGSISSVATGGSSRTKPAPAKSILSSSSSTKGTKRRSPPSVKFLDVPEVHYEDEDEFPYRSLPSSAPIFPIASAPAHAPASRVEKKSGFLLRWIPRPWAAKKTQQAPPSGRPSISGPFPLTEAPLRRARDGTAASLRSVRSRDSLSSVQSHSSRLQTYWSKLTGKVS